MLDPRSVDARAANGLAALVSGLALFLATTFVGGILAAVAVPTDYFAFFGRQHTELALFVVNTMIFAFPLAAIGLLWYFVTKRFVRLSAASLAMFCLTGYLLGLGYMYMEAVASFLALEAEGKVPLSVFLRSGLTWWNVPNFVAVPLGIVGAAMLAARSLRTAQ
jgi:archaellum biogenesis protein FlaJ (TadC family)